MSLSLKQLQVNTFLMFVLLVTVLRIVEHFIFNLLLKTRNVTISTCFVKIMKLTYLGVSYNAKEPARGS